MTEHQTILRVVDALALFGDAVRRGGGDREELFRFLTFIRDYADALHHGKEEEILFVAMVEAGFPREAGPIATMLAEHDVGREHVATLLGLAGTRVEWSPADREEVYLSARGYAELLRAHVRKEDEVLYPMAEQRLPPALKARVDERCAAFDARHTQDGSRERLEQLATELVTRHLGAAVADVEAW
ncbi:MAG TPA: hemerythrin domain-containing protein [Anaeromyxobacteraceae bacterium]|nr:hemerythrin domain-containing protein [Anaeromyxobacteraceae bacterium]